MPPSSVLPDFHALRSKRRGHEAVLYAFDLIEDDGIDLPLLDRKRRLKKLLGKSQRRAIRFVEHLMGDGPTIFEHVCRMGLEGIETKQTHAPYRSGPSRTWLKCKNPESAAVRREREEALDQPAVDRRAVSPPASALSGANSAGIIADRQMPP